LPESHNRVGRVCQAHLPHRQVEHRFILIDDDFRDGESTELERLWGRLAFHGAFQ
jgi:hypothetical protein